MYQHPNLATGAREAKIRANFANNRVRQRAQAAERAAGILGFERDGVYQGQERIRIARVYAARRRNFVTGLAVVSLLITMPGDILRL